MYESLGLEPFWWSIQYLYPARMIHVYPLEHDLGIPSLEIQYTNLHPATDQKIEWNGDVCTKVPLSALKLASPYGLTSLICHEFSRIMPSLQ